MRIPTFEECPRLGAGHPGRNGFPSLACFSTVEKMTTVLVSQSSHTHAFLSFILLLGSWFSPIVKIASILTRGQGNSCMRPYRVPESQKATFQIRWVLGPCGLCLVQGF